MSVVPETLHFCACFDQKYLAHGLALYVSLRRHCARPVVFWVLCFDRDTSLALQKLNLAGIRLLSLEELEKSHAGLIEAKSNRSRMEFYWTCTPCLPLQILQQNADVDLITYLDADMEFHEDPAPIYEEMADASIMIVEHRYAPRHEYRAGLNGIYNVGLLAFRRDTKSLRCLQWWKDRCLEWCYANPEEGKFGDQKYLDDWPQRFEGVRVLANAGAGVAPWNIETAEVSNVKGKWMVNGVPLIFFHFHGMVQVGRQLFLACPGDYVPGIGKILGLYCAYGRRRLASARQLETLGMSIEYQRHPLRENIAGFGEHRLVWVRSALLTRVLWRIFGLRSSAMALLHEARVAYAKGDRLVAWKRLAEAVCVWPPLLLNASRLMLIVRLLAGVPAGPFRVSVWDRCRSVRSRLRRRGLNRNAE